MTEFIFRFTFNLKDRTSVALARKEFGGLLRKLNLKYRSEKSFECYEYSPRSIERPWVLVFLILPPERPQDKYWESLRLLTQSYLKPLLAAHPALGDVSIYRNVGDFPDLIHTTSDWWR